MVIDSIRNAPLYYGLGDRIVSALKFLQESDFSAMEPGKYEIDGSNVYALVQKYESKPREAGKWEAHRKYIDVQYVSEGTEQMGYACIDAMKVTKEYDGEGDYLLLEGEGSMLVCRAGTFAIFSPEDAHMPGIALDKPQEIKKVVVKVRV